MGHNLETARTGMIQHERNVEAIANNLANMNTVGYKRLAVHFQDLLSSQEALNVLFDDADLAPSSGVALDEMSRVMEQGALVPNRDPLSFAISGAGFFQIRVDETTVAYSRDGSFNLDGEGFLVTVDGFRLEPPIQILGKVVELAISREGLVSVRTEARGALDEIGQLELSLFTDPSQLQSAGLNLLLPSAESGEAQVVTPGADGAGEVVSGALEASNVNLAAEMTNLIAAQRAYQFNLVAFQTADEMLQQLNDATAV